MVNGIDSSITVFLTNFNQSLPQQNKILNQEGYTFRHIATGDFDNDTETDIVVINFNSDTITVFLVNPCQKMPAGSYRKTSEKHTENGSSIPTGKSPDFS